MTDAEIRTRLQDRLQPIEERIVGASRRAGRARSEVTFVAVTKTVSSRVAGILLELGIHDLGESRPQELWKKAKDLADRNIRWHMIGHLQRNKIKPTVELTRLIHSVDSSRLMDALNRETAHLLPILLEVNASREANKHGFAPQEVEMVAESLASYPNLRVDGLMTMAAFGEEPEQARPTFRQVRRLRDALGLKHLSMGMSNDFEVAIEEGATLIRLGSILFDGLESEHV